MSYDDRWKLNEDDVCVESRDGYFFGSKECETYKENRDRHLRTLRNDEPSEWDYGKTKNERTKWCAPKVGGEFTSFRECEERRLVQILNMNLAELGDKGLKTANSHSNRPWRRDKSPSVVDRATEVNPVTFAETATQVMEDLVAGTEVEKLRSELDASRAGEEQKKKDTAKLVQNMQKMLSDALNEFSTSDAAAKRARKRMEREKKRQMSADALLKARVASEESLRFRTAVDAKARELCGDAIRELENCTREAEARRERSINALRALRVPVLTTIIYFLTYVKTTMDHRIRTGLNRLSSVENDPELLEYDGPLYHGTRTSP